MKVSRAFWLALTLWGARALCAEDSCARAFTVSAQLSKAGDLEAARVALVSCAAERCPAAMRPLCVEDLRKLEARMPSIVVVAKDAAGADVVELSLVVDGKTVLTRLDGKATELNPGTHVLRFEQNGQPVDEQQVVIREGEKGRPIAVQWRPSPVAAAAVAPVPPKPSSDVVRVVNAAPSRPLSVFFLAGASLVAGGLWAGFGISGFLQRGSLESCKGGCPAPLIQSARTAFLVADISAIVSLVSAGVALVLEFTRPSVPSEAP